MKKATALFYHSNEGKEMWERRDHQGRAIQTERQDGKSSASI